MNNSKESLLDELHMDDQVSTIRETIINFFPDFQEKKFLMDGKTFPLGEYVRIPISECSVENAGNFKTTNTFVYVDRNSIGEMKKRIKFIIQRDSLNCTFIFACIPNSGLSKFVLKTNGSRVLSISSSRMSHTTRLDGASSLIIGEATLIVSARMVLYDTDVRIGAGGLWSDEIIIQGTDQHGIIDLRTRNIANGGRKYIDIGRRVWVGRRSVIGKNVSIGDGSIIGIGAMVTKNVPEAAAVGSNPARILKRAVTWCHRPGGTLAKEIADIDRLAELHGRLPKSGRGRLSERVTSLVTSSWARALVAGACGAALFEAFSALVFAP